MPDRGTRFDDPSSQAVASEINAKRQNSISVIATFINPQGAKPGVRKLAYAGFDMKRLGVVDQPLEYFPNLHLPPNPSEIHQ